MNKEKIKDLISQMIQNSEFKTADEFIEKLYVSGTTDWMMAPMNDSLLKKDIEIEERMELALNDYYGQKIAYDLLNDLATVEGEMASFENQFYLKEGILIGYLLYEMVQG